MAFFSVSSLLTEKPVPTPAPPPRKLKLPPRPAVTRNETPEPRVAPQAQQQRQQRATASATRTATRQQAERETRQANAEQRQEAAALTILLPYDGQGGQGGDGRGGQRGGDGENDGELTGAATRAMPDMAADDIDCHMLAGLLPTTGDDGIFEVLLPCGGKLGVAVEIGQRSTSFLLMPSTERLRSQIKKKKMELENALERRMETQIRLTVL